MSLRLFIRDLVADFRARKILPDAPRHDDLYLVEFPKSGITWLTFLFANTNLALANSRRKVTFFNLNEFVPDIHFERRLAPPSPGGLGFRCIKSHSVFTPQYARVFYLVRDPRHVMASYYRYVTELNLWSGSFEDFVRHPEFGVRAWKAHVEGWLDQVNPATAFTLLRYEDLLEDTAGTLQKLYRHLGYEVDDAMAAKSVERSSLDGMRAEEDFFNSGHPRLVEFHFVRKEQSGGTRVPLPPGVKSYIETEAAGIMAKLGYIA